VNVNTIAEGIGAVLEGNKSPPVIVLVVNEEGGISMIGFGFSDEADIVDTFHAIAAKAVDSSFHTLN